MFSFYRIGRRFRRDEIDDDPDSTLEIRVNVISEPQANVIRLRNLTIEKREEELRKAREREER